jgi:hypothetical protein
MNSCEGQDTRRLQAYLLLQPHRVPPACTGNLPSTQQLLGGMQLAKRPTWRTHSPLTAQCHASAAGAAGRCERHTLPSSCWGLQSLPNLGCAQCAAYWQEPGGCCSTMGSQLVPGMHQPWNPAVCASHHGKRHTRATHPAGPPPGVPHSMTAQLHYYLGSNLQWCVSTTKEESPSCPGPRPAQAACCLQRTNQGAAQGSTP